MAQPWLLHAAFLQSTECLEIEKGKAVFITKRNNSNFLEVTLAFYSIYSSFMSVFLNVLKGNLEGVNNNNVHRDYFNLPTGQIIELGLKLRIQSISFQILCFFHYNKF